MADAPGITFFAEPFSHWCIKVDRILRFKHLAYTTRRVGYHDKRELIAATGQDYVPTLVIEGPAVAGRSIVLYPDIPDTLERMAPEPTLFPPGAPRALCRVLEDWAHERLEELAWRVAAPSMPQTFEDEHERWVFEEIQTIKRGPLALMEKRRPEFEAALGTLCALLEDMLGEGGFLLGNRPSLADFAVFGALAPVRYAGLELPSRFTRLAGWYESIGRL